MVVSTPPSGYGGGEGYGYGGEAAWALGKQARHVSFVGAWLVEARYTAIDDTVDKTFR